MRFLISPAMLKEITRKQNECEVNQSCLKINGAKFVYITRLNAVDAEEDE